MVRINRREYVSDFRRGAFVKLAHASVNIRFIRLASTAVSRFNSVTYARVDSGLLRSNTVTRLKLGHSRPIIDCAMRAVASLENFMRSRGPPTL
jgi:hypothetical protein